MTSRAPCKRPNTEYRSKKTGLCTRKGDCVKEEYFDVHEERCLPRAKRNRGQAEFGQLQYAPRLPKTKKPATPERETPSPFDAAFLNTNAPEKNQNPMRRQRNQGSTQGSSTKGLTKGSRRLGSNELRKFKNYSVINRASVLGKKTAKLVAPKPRPSSPPKTLVEPPQVRPSSAPRPPSQKPPTPMRNLSNSLQCDKEPLSQTQIMDYQLRRETGYGNPAERFKPVEISPETYEKIASVIEDSKKNNLPKIDRQTFKAFLSERNVTISKKMKEKTELGQLCNFVEKYLTERFGYNRDEPEATKSFLMNMPKPEARLVLEKIYNDFRPPGVAYDVEYDDDVDGNAVMQPSIGLQNLNTVMNGVYGWQILVRPESKEVEKTPPWTDHLKEGTRVLAREDERTVKLMPGTIVAVHPADEPTYHAMMTSAERRNYKESVKNCINKFIDVPTLAPNLPPKVQVKKTEFTEEKLQTWMRMYFGPTGAYSDSKVLADFEAKRPVTLERKMFEKLVGFWKKEYTNVDEVLAENKIAEKAAPKAKKLNADALSLFGNMKMRKPEDGV